MKKGRHRRFEEARALKHVSDSLFEPDPASLRPCAECGAEPGDPHASWCMADEEIEADDDMDADEEIEEDEPTRP